MSNTEIILIPKNATPEIIETSIAAFNQPLADLLSHVGLPTENLLSPIDERRKVIFSLEAAISVLPVDAREKAVYLSKFTVAVAVGLFDGAINFLWDETVKALRILISEFDLPYFLFIAQSVNSKYKSFSRPEDLEGISDHDLLDICRRIGFISDINYKRLEYVNYLRNHASAAHPNDNAVTGFEMVNLLETCLKYAITVKPDHSVIQIKQLFNNIRTKEIPKEDFEAIGDDLIKQPQERLDDFLFSLFGLYTDIRTEQQVRKNIDRLTVHIWEAISEDVKYRIGAKFGIYRLNGDTERKDFVQKFLETVGGLKYKDEDSLAGELLEKLQNLKTVHFEWNNFYNEYAHAKSIDSSLPATGLPDSIRKLFVKVITICYVGNGKGYRQGIDERAAPFYNKFIERFTVKEIKEFLGLFKDAEFVTDFDYTTPDHRLRNLVKFFKTKTSDIYINRILDLILSYPAKKLQSLSDDKRYQEAMKFVK